jgi:hydrogenase nickel incorporation protein HypB
MEIITIQRKVLEKNDEIAAENRQLFRDKGVLTLNLVSSPGAGKTTLLERTIEHFRNRFRLAVIEGDVQTNLDAKRVAAYSVPVVQLVTNGLCHLEARLVQDALQNLNLDGTHLLFIENVGNLICPSSYDLGEDHKIVISSVAEGDDKPLKYPRMFQLASVLIINKTDLLPYLDCNVAVLRENALKVNPSLQVFQLSAQTGEGLESWYEWLERKIGHN